MANMPSNEVAYLWVPSQQMFRGKLIDNTRKFVRGVEFDGRWKSGKYDANQGVVLGSEAMTKRLGILMIKINADALPLLYA